MSFDFWNDLKDAERVEELALKIFQDRTDQYELVGVHNERQYFKRGDIIARDKEGREFFLEIKGDKRIGDTGNIFCEEENFWYDSGAFTKGNFYNDYQYYCVVSESTRRVYILDFAILRKHYNKPGHSFIKVSHNDNDSYGYLYPLAEAKAHGALITTIEY